MAVVIEELDVQQAPQPSEAPASAPAPAAGHSEIEPQALVEALAHHQWQQARLHSD